MKVSVQYLVGTKSGGRVEIDCDAWAEWNPKERETGCVMFDGGWEIDGWEPVEATWYHADGLWSTIKLVKGSILHALAEEFLGVDERSDELCRLVKYAANEKAKAES